MTPAWFPDWQGEACALVGAGQSATAEAVAALRNRVRVAVVNTSYQLAPWADVLYACDRRWWEWHDGVPEFLGLKITQDETAATRFGLRKVDLVHAAHPARHELQMERNGVLGRGQNGGFQLLNLLLQFGVRRLLLLGIDCRGGRWHGGHPVSPDRPGQSPETLARWAAHFDAQAPRLASLGAAVVNLSPASALQAFPKMTLDAALAQWK